MQKLFLLFAAGALLCAGTVQAQDEAPSLGDVARQSRQQKQQKDAPAKDGSAKPVPTKDAPSAEPVAKDAAAAKQPRVLTNEDLPQGGLATDAQRDLKPYDAPDAVETPVGNHDAQGEQWKSRIQAQKSAVASIQHEIDTITESIHYAGANCVANCVQWNERQKQKQDQVEGMKSQLSEQQKHLEEMQEAARKQGFGSSVYEP